MDKDKEKLIETLKEMPIVQIACKKAGVSRATYYRWRKEDKIFLRQSEDALAQGIEFINDMSESQLITLIREKKMPAITLWLKHNNKRYGSNIRSYVPITNTEDLTEEENAIILEALAMASGNPINYDTHHTSTDRSNQSQQTDQTASIIPKPLVVQLAVSQTSFQPFLCTVSSGNVLSRATKRK